MTLLKKIKLSSMIMLMSTFAHVQTEVGINFTAMTSYDTPFTPGGTVPPDTEAAVGPTQLVVALNQGIRSYKIDRKTKKIKPDEILDIPLACVAGNCTLGSFDPHILYDESSKNWFIISIDSFAPNNTFSITVGLTHTTNGTITNATQWKLFKFQHNLIPEALGPNVRNGCNCLGQGGDNGAAFDFNQLSLDKHAVYITANMRFNVGPNERDITSLFVIQKKIIVM